MSDRSIVPARYPALRALVWNRDPEVPLDGPTALAIYEAEWRHVDTARLTDEEQALIRSLARDHGGGAFLPVGDAYGLMGKVPEGD